MGRLTVTAIALACAVALAGSAASAACTREDFAKAVDGAGASLRKLNAETAPRLQAKMRQLKTKMNWPDASYEEKGFQLLQDERIAALDAQANDRLARIDTLGTINPSAEPDCGKLDELSAASLELQATVKAKATYMLAKMDQILEGGPIAPLATAEPRSGEPKAAEPKSKEPKTGEWKTGEAKVAEPKAPAVQPAPSPKQQTAKAEPPAKTDRPAKAPAEPPRDMVVIAPSDKATPTPPGPLSPDEEGYTIDEIRAASAGFFGQVSANLGAVIEHFFRNSGRPTGYVLGTEGGGAFLAGVRYGKGTLYLRSGGSQKIFWHGPSLGVDVGGEGSKTLFLIYKLHGPDELYSTFTGVDGSAYLVGGVGATLVTNGNVVMAPIRSGLGLRVGANIGYIRFTSKATWNPF